MNEEDLHRLLRRSDPARTLPPLTAARIHTLTEHAMTPTTDSPAPGTVQGSRPARPRRLLLGVGAALAGVAAVTAIAIPPLAGPAAAPTALKAPTSSAGLETACAPVSADFIGRAEIAFRGEVTGIRDGVVTLQVQHRYTGDIGQTVTIPQGEAGAFDGSAPTFTTGSEYLVAATDRTVLVCGSTDTDTPALRAIYDRAFAK